MFSNRDFAIFLKVTFFLTVSLQPRWASRPRFIFAHVDPDSSVDFKMFERSRAGPHCPGSHHSRVPEWIVDQDNHDRTFFFTMCIHFSFKFVTSHAFACPSMQFKSYNECLLFCSMSFKFPTLVLEVHVEPQSAGVRQAFMCLIVRGSFRLLPRSTSWTLDVW